MSKSSVPDLKDIKCLQINLNHCTAANVSAKKFAIENNIDIIFTQDAYCNTRGELMVFPKDWPSFSSKTNNAHIIICSRELIFSFVGSTDDAVFISIQTKQATFLLGSCYAQPSGNLSESLQEIEPILTHTRPFLCAGDYNANSTLWGEHKEDNRGQILIEFFIINNLNIINSFNKVNTFEKINNEGNIVARGWPDLTIVNPKMQHYIKNWEVSDQYTASDHKYITFNLNADPLLSIRRRLNTERGKFSKFDRLIKSHLPTLNLALENLDTVERLEHFTEFFIQRIQNAAVQCFRFKGVKKQRTFTFWNEDLTSQRNRLTALRRKIFNIKKNDPLNPNLKLLASDRCKSAARYKKSIMLTRKAAWKKFCSEISNPFTTQQKIFTSKFFTPTEITKSFSSSKASRKFNLEEITKQLFDLNPPVNKFVLSNYNLQPDDPPITKLEISTALSAIDYKKAPGPDGIDFRLVRRIFNSIPGIIKRWTNFCLSFGYFPQCLRKGEVVYFLKKGKSPELASSYRPICLLPTLGKLLEKIIIFRLNHHLEKHSLIHPNQFGFREGHSCELALETILSACRTQMESGRYTSILSTDISGAFDSVEWSVVVEQLIKLNCPGNIVRFISTYLSKRFILINWGAGYSEYQIFKGTPQGSCLGPYIWLLIANIILIELTKAGFLLYAFADDFTFVFSGKTRKGLELSAEKALNIFTSLLSSLNLTLSHDKSKLLVFNKPRKLDESHPPSIKINNKNVKSVHSLKLLGITIDKQLNWLPHISYLKSKLLALHQNLIRLTGRSWGVPSFFLKIWYSTIIERILLYGIGIWGGALTKQAKQKLYSLQRLFLLPISKGYRTISTDALCAVTGIPPITIKLEYEYLKARVLHLQDQHVTENLFPGHTIQFKVPKWTLHPTKDLSSLLVNISKNPPITHITQYSVYTDGSKSDSGVASAYCVYKNNIQIHSWSAKLNNEATIFQAELLAIEQALVWIRDSSSSIEKPHFFIYSDSLSSLFAIKSQRTTHPKILKIKHILNSFNFSVTLQHVSAHTGIAGNEDVDALARMTTNLTDVELTLPLAKSYIKSFFKARLLTQWQSYWDNSGKGRHTFELIPSVSDALHTSSPHMTAFLTGHGPFSTHLLKFKVLNNNLCACGSIMSPKHIYYNCIHTRRWHIKGPTIGPVPKNWLKNIENRPSIQNKLRQIYNFMLAFSNRT